MKYVSLVIVGLIVGILARFFYPGQVPLNWLWSIALGIAGSFLAGLLGDMLHKSGDGKIHAAGFISSILGAMLLIFLARNVFHLV